MQWLLKVFAVHKHYVVLSAALTLSLLMMALKEDRKAEVVRSTTIAILRGGQWAFSWVTKISDLRQENRFLRERNAELSFEVQRLRSIKFENLRLRKLLGFKEQCEFSLLPAEVIAHGTERIVNSILIGVGSEDGVRKDMPVLTAEGLVGRVFRVFPTTAVVQLLTDRNCRVSATVLNEKRIIGIIEWRGGAVLELKNVPVRSDIKVGDVVVSSGLGGIFPRGLKIGSVTKVGGEELGLFREVEVRPSARFSELEEVFVVVRQSKAEGKTE
ncbi:MAG TPA: rod shape-determining protein MreC [Candidatus Latescibacteria bacterium]|nr:rod shape-determining protein MreC [Candidatus Latescibacterota bacterium]